VNSRPVVLSAKEQIFPGGRFRQTSEQLEVPDPSMQAAVLKWLPGSERAELLERDAFFLSELFSDREVAIRTGHPDLAEEEVYRRLCAQWVLFVLGDPGGDPLSHRYIDDTLKSFGDKDKATRELFHRRIGRSESIEVARAFHQRANRQRRGIQEERTVCRYCKKFFTRKIKGNSLDICPKKECRNRYDAGRTRKTYQRRYGQL
jgi:hypothetical protein